MTASSILILSPDDIDRVFDVGSAISSQEVAFQSLGEATGHRSPRALVPGPEDSVAFCYTDRRSADSAAVTKFGSVNPGNAGRGRPSISAVITVLDPLTGAVQAIMDGVRVTTLRTSAASAVAVRALARPGARQLAVIGSGVQAEAHVRAIAHAMPSIASVRIWSPAAAELTALVARLDDLGGVRVTAAADAADAVANAEITVLCTTSHTPVIEDDWVTPGMTVVSIGSFAPDRSEVPIALAARARVVVDDVSSALTDAGPIIDAIANGDLEPASLTSLGDIVTGRSPGRRGPDEVVYYNSVGVGAQDAAAAESILSRAQRAGIGTEVSW